MMMMMVMILSSERRDGDAGSDDVEKIDDDIDGVTYTK